MRLSFGQQLKMAQKQVLAPRMIQSMEILQLPILALQERIEQEMEENPVLDLVESDPDLPDEQFEAEKADAKAETEKELVVDESKDNQDDFERLDHMNEEWPETFEERRQPSANRIEQDALRRHDAMANMVSRPQTLQDHLHNQIGWFDLEEEMRLLVDRIIYNLNDDGRLAGQLCDLLEADAPPERLALAEEALAIVQRLDPAGVGARTDQECLLLQLEPGMPLEQEMRKLIENHLEDLAANRLPLISKKTGYSIEQIHAIWDELKKLNPHPGSLFRDTHVPAVTPDVFVERDDEGKYVVRLEDERTPTLNISSYYRKLLSNPETNEETREYIKRKINAAQWLIDSIQQRQSTLTRVSQAIVDHQTEFLDKGPEAIEPLKMQQIADKVGVHVTTVSRAVDDKWIQTARGLFPLKKLFVGGTVSSDGKEVAYDAVRIKLQEIVDGEDKQKPFSDDELVRQLDREGLKVARRTVTKYRKSMGIGSSRQRREWRDDEK